MWAGEKAGGRYGYKHDCQVSALKWGTFIKIENTEWHGGLWEHTQLAWIGDFLTVNAVGIQVLGLTSHMLASREKK